MVLGERQEPARIRYKVRREHTRLSQIIHGTILVTFSGFFEHCINASVFEGFLYIQKYKVSNGKLTPDSAAKMT